MGARVLPLMSDVHVRTTSNLPTVPLIRRLEAMDAALSHQRTSDYHRLPLLPVGRRGQGVISAQKSS